MHLNQTITESRPERELIDRAIAQLESLTASSNAARRFRTRGAVGNQEAQRNGAKFRADDEVLGDAAKGASA
jgi:hypothetical protein